jgi:peptidoglycan/LPS O-acetylase OafA/YrhL
VCEFDADDRFAWHAITWPIRTIVDSSNFFAVPTFFFLSAFVLYLPYASGKRRFDSALDVRRFIVHRNARLLPLYFISMFIFILIG